MTAKQKILLDICIIIASVLFLVFGIGGYLISSITDGSAMLVKKTLEKDLLEVQRKKFPELKKQFYEAQKELGQLDNFLPSAEGLINVISEIEDMAKASGNQNQIETVSQENNLKTIDSFTVRLTLRGSYASLHKFLLLVKNAPSAIEITDLRISKLGDLAGIYGLNANSSESVMEIKIYLNDEKD